MECVSTVRYQVLINGEPTDTITPRCRLRQGDPLSPYLFIICMEVLSWQIRDLEEAKLIKGIKIARRAPSVSHFFFADDALFFIQADKDGCNNLKATLEKFCDISGEVVNLSKSSIIFSPNISDEERKERKDIMAVTIKSDIGIYLGSPISFSNSKTKDFQFLCDKVSARISSWSASTLTQAGKLILINGVLASLCNHILSIFLLPKKITNAMDSMIKRVFLESKR